MKTRLFTVNQINLLGCYADPDLRIYIYKKNFDLICHKKILSILDFWITKDLYYIQQEQDGSLKLKILSAFEKETAIKLTANDLITFKVSGDWVYVVRLYKLILDVIGWFVYIFKTRSSCCYFEYESFFTAGVFGL